MKHAGVITNLPSKYDGDFQKGVFYAYVPTRRRCTPRYVLPTPYAAHYARGTPFGSQTIGFGQVYGSLRAEALLNSGQHDGSWEADLYNKAYSRLTERLQYADRRDSDVSKAELGVTFLEYRKTVSWVEEAVDAIADFTDKVKFDPSGRRLAEARARVLASRRKKKRRLKPLTSAQVMMLVRKRWGVPRWLSSRWLDYWMVVAPTLGDVHSGLQVLSRDVRFGYIAGTCSALDKIQYLSEWGPYVTVEDGWSKRTTRIAVHVVCRNPNLALANSLGLLNPLTVGLELVPWTWLVGWFVNWKQVLGAWSDFAGYDLSRGYITRTNQYDSDRRQTSDGWLTSSGNTVWGKATHRQASLPTYPKLVVRLPDRLSITRAFTSMSLVTNLLTSVR